MIFLILKKKYKMKTCKTCKSEKDLSSFEVNRAVCKTCRQIQRTEAAKKCFVDPLSIPKPKSCVKCGKSNEEVEFKFRTDLIKGGWRTECNTCYNAKGYSEKSRSKRREENEELYLAKNAKSHLEWAQNNPEKIKEQQYKTASEAPRKIKTIKTSAKARGIGFDDSSMEAMALKLLQPCYYCDFTPKQNNILNGLDRMDPEKGYNDINTIPCCATCNAMKGPHTLDVFIASIRDIVNYHSNTMDMIGGRQRLKPFSGRNELREKPEKEKKDNLTTEMKINLWSQPCYLCGRSPSFGIDREDADGDYTIENSRPCCSKCNYMKKDISLADFLKHTCYIHQHTSHWILQDVTNIHNFTMAKQELTQVKANLINTKKYIIFPSIGIAAKVLSITRPVIYKALDHDKFTCMGCTWVTVEPREYLEQNMNSSDTIQMIKTIRSLGKRNKSI